MLYENQVGRYVERGRGGIYWTSDTRHAPSPLELTRLAAERYPDLFRPALENLNNLSEHSLLQIVSRAPDNWMSEAAKRFSVALMRYNLEKLKETIQC